MTDQNQEAPAEQLKDIKKNCKNCGRPFVITVKDQQFMKKMVENGTWETYVEPNKCINCRRLKRQQQPVA